MDVSNIFFLFLSLSCVALLKKKEKESVVHFRSKVAQRFRTLSLILSFTQPFVFLVCLAFPFLSFIGNKQIVRFKKTDHSSLSVLELTTNKGSSLLDEIIFVALVKVCRLIELFALVAVSGELI